MRFVVVYNDKTIPRISFLHGKEQLLKCLSKILDEHELISITGHKDESPLMSSMDEFE